MAANRTLAELFDRMAKVLELTGANRFKVNAYQRGSRALRDAVVEVDTLDRSVAALTEIEGIGKGLAEKIIEYLDTGHVAEHDQVVATVPPGVLAMLDVPGLGPKTVATLWKQADIESIDALKAALDSDALASLPRMGARRIESLRKSLAFIGSAESRVRIGRAYPVAIYFVEQLARHEPVRRVEYAGSLRRGAETIGDVDILCACEEGFDVAAVFCNLDPVEHVLARGATKCSVRIEGGLQVDLRIVDEDRFGAALMYFTGSKEHNVRLRERALKRNLRLNEYGLWRADEQTDASADAHDAQAQAAEPVAAATEADVYAALDLAWVPPELREDRGEIAAAEAGELPDLVSLDDIRCELHAHTVASDGRLSIDEMAALAADRGFHTLAITDHSASQVQARGLDVERLERHIEAVREADGRHKNIKLLAGSEVDILADGRLDYPNSLLKQLDIVVASPHAALSQPPAKATGRLRRAIDHPLVHMIGHATGRLINRRPGLTPDFAELFKAAADAGVAFEINANPARLDLRDTQARAAIDAGVKLAVNTDAHSAADLETLRFGVLTARRAWATAADVVNCLDAACLWAWLKQRR